VNRSPLSACPRCSRHVRIDEPACPFCRAELPAHFAAPAALRPAGRLNRAALMALRMGAIGATAAACGGTVAAGTSGDSGPDDARNAPPGTVLDGSNDDATSWSEPSYGASPLPAYGGPGVVNDDGGSDAQNPPPGTVVDGSEDEDASIVFDDAAYGGPGVLYGAFDFDATLPESDAGTEEDARNVAVPYGLPPVHQ
jgi:hypothetical protein